MWGSKKKSDSEKGSSSSADQMRFEEGDPRILKLGSPVSTLRSGMSSSNTTSTSGSSASGSGRNVSSSSSSGSNRIKIVPPGNICPSGNVITGMRCKPERTVLNDSKMIPGIYGYGSIMPGGAMQRTRCAEELNTQANEIYRKGNFAEALSLYDKAIAISPRDGRFHCNRAAALMGLKRIIEAVKECEEAIRLSPAYVRAHQRLGTLLLCLGQVENAREYLHCLDQKPDQATLEKLQAVEEHIGKCAVARRSEDWTTMLKKAVAATTSGADASPQLFACQAEAHLKLHQLKDAELWIYKARTYELSATECRSKIFGMLSEAYIFFVQAQIDSSLGKFDDACTAIERAARIDLQSAEVTGKLKNMRLVGKARTHGNEHFNAKRYAQACTAYGEGILLDSSNSVLYYNRANCWFKLGEWEKSLDDCTHALLIRPQYTKALFRKAASNIKLERWADAVRDYEILRQELPSNEEVAENLSHARAELRKSRREGNGKVELVSDLDKFRAAIASGASVVCFDELSKPQGTWMSSVMDNLSAKYRSVIFLKVDMEQSPAIATAEKVTVAPTFKLYKDGNRQVDTVTAIPDFLDFLIKDTLLDPI
ncbi:inactive TPR repeat-containing thioredoxin TTL3-like [Solanum lycopersicum]|uniref:inactive TPR repeat-containing thioredoxin TTL3-like n=1 Tax=Solanum lycopersicum TaxID=4081 RepID=UPI000276B1BF|nr:inactive TPR repeat-containing thioredoxin TTL3-like [Solanum lycopersicum]